MIWLATLAFILLDVKFNAWRISIGNNISHVLNGIYRVVFYALMIYLFKPSFLQGLMYLLGSFFSAWFLFNLLLNYLRHLPIDYLGKDSVLDRFEAKLPWIVWAIWKVIAASGFIYAYYHSELL